MLLPVEFMSMPELIRKHENKGKHFFDRAWLRFAHSKILSDVFWGADGWYFVSSERQQFLNGSFGPRAYTVRRMSADYMRIDTLGDYQMYGTARGAKAHAKRLAELSLYGTATCPTTRGIDLELWDQLEVFKIRARQQREWDIDRENEARKKQSAELYAV